MNTRSIVVGQFLDPRFLLPKEAVLCAKKSNIYGSIILLLRCAIKN